MSEVPLQNFPRSVLSDVIRRFAAPESARIEHVELRGILCCLGGGRAWSLPHASQKMGVCVNGHVRRPTPRTSAAGDAVSCEPGSTINPKPETLHWCKWR